MALEPWPVVGGPRTVFEHPFHPTIVEEDVELPDGQVLPWLRYVTDVDGVMGICVEDGKVLLSRQYNPGARRVMWEFPGGGTHPGEDYAIADLAGMIRDGELDNTVVLSGWAQLLVSGWSDE